jgi:Holliday junction resolvasome RuvABC DNA-binding subunit
MTNRIMMRVKHLLWRNSCATGPITAVTEDGAYSFQAPTHSWYWEIAPDGHRVTVTVERIYTLCRQDGNGVQTWFGFRDIDEMDLFNVMITADGVGPGIALKILSRTPSEEISALVKKGDREAFARLPGVGPKTGQALIKVLFAAAPAQGATAAPDPKVTAALQALGYKAQVAKETVSQSMKDKPDLTTEDRVRYCLKLLQ